ncbi:MAG: response regulator [Candidatus Thorarchaeota archaeon]
MSNKEELNNPIEKTEDMIRYEKETGKYAIWRGVVTEGFKKWLKGEKVYNRDKERISLYVSDETKKKWAEFIDSSNYTTISKLIRDSVKDFIENRHSNRSPKKFSDISHALKEPLTSIKGYSQLLLENYKEQLNNNISSTIKNIFEQSKDLEKKIIKFLDNIKDEGTKCHVFLIEDDTATIRLITNYFGAKGYICRGEGSGAKGIEELKNCHPKIILLDIILPDISGYDICKQIKTDSKYRDTPVYFLTAISGSEVENHMKETGADGYILKPFDLSDFKEILDILNKGA